MSKEAIQKGIDALRGVIAWDIMRNNLVPYRVRDPIHEAIEALAELAEQPAQQEPVAWRIRCTDPMRDWVLMYRHPRTEEQFSNMEIQPLYTSPPAQRTWVGLNEDQRQQVRSICDADIPAHVFHAIEAKLKEKNT